MGRLDVPKPTVPNKKSGIVEITKQLKISDLKIKGPIDKMSLENFVPRFFKLRITSMV